jgi:hypothetical protein
MSVDRLEAWKTQGGDVCVYPCRETSKGRRGQPLSPVGAKLSPKIRLSLINREDIHHRARKVHDNDQRGVHGCEVRETHAPSHV